MARAIDQAWQVNPITPPTIVIAFAHPVWRAVSASIKPPSAALGASGPGFYNSVMGVALFMQLPAIKPLNVAAQPVLQ
jgi:hypothetical protein